MLQAAVSDATDRLFLCALTAETDMTSLVPPLYRPFVNGVLVLRPAALTDAACRWLYADGVTLDISAPLMSITDPFQLAANVSQPLCWPWHACGWWTPPPTRGPLDSFVACIATQIESSPATSNAFGAQKLLADAVTVFGGVAAMGKLFIWASAEFAVWRLAVRQLLVLERHGNLLADIVADVERRLQSQCHVEQHAGRIRRSFCCASLV